MEQKCPNCNGGGVIQEYDEFDRYHVLECSQCGGSGVIDTNELKPCPFCGGEADWHINEDAYDVLCIECWSGTSVYTTKQEAIEAWNRRC